jgi:2-haloacid dehalogenase
MASQGTIAFDMIGTCFGLDKPKQRLVELGAPKYALQLWFAQALRDAFALSHAGGYQPLKQILEAELPRTLKLLGIETSSEQRSQVISAFNELEIEPGALEAFQRLTEAGWRLVALTNGSAESTQKLLKRAGVLQHFAEVRSCDEIQITKPNLKVYQLLQQNEQGEIWMIAAHAWDIAGALRAGLKTAFITSEEEIYLSTYSQPDVIAPGLIEAIDQIIGM